MTNAKDWEWLMSSSREATAVCWMKQSLDMQHRIIRDLSHTGKAASEEPEENRGGGLLAEGSASVAAVLKPDLTCMTEHVGVESQRLLFTVVNWEGGALQHQVGGGDKSLPTCFRDLSSSAGHVTGCPVCGL